MRSRIRGAVVSLAPVLTLAFIVVQNAKRWS